MAVLETTPGRLILGLSGTGMRQYGQSDYFSASSQTKVTSPDSMPTVSMSHAPYGMCSSISPGQYVSSAFNFSYSMYQSPENIPEPVGAVRGFQPSPESRVVNQQTGEPSPLFQPGFTQARSSNV